MSEQPLHSIQNVSARTGLSAHVIRVWERRYAAVTPKRSDGGRRLYSDREVERLIALREATQAGHSIGVIAGMTMKQISSITGKARSEAGSRAMDASAALRAECLDAVKQLEGAGLQDALQRGLVMFGQRGVLQMVVSPLAEEVGERWRSGAFAAAHEHFFTSAAKIFLGRLNKYFTPGSAMPNLIACTPSGQLHELGAFMVGVAASHIGWRVTYLGAGLPAAEIAGAVAQNEAAAVALSIVYPGDDPCLSEELLDLKKFLPEGTQIIAGGRCAAGYRYALDRIGAVVVGSLDECCEVLDRLRMQRAVNRNRARE